MPGYLGPGSARLRANAPRAVRDDNRGAFPPASLHVVRRPVLGDHDGGFRGVPAVDAIVLARTEMILPGPFDGAAAQALGVDLHGFQRAADLSRVGRPAGALERSLDDHAGNPALRHLVARIAGIGLPGRIRDLAMDRQVV